jgi:hypothetical protein
MNPSVSDVYAKFTRMIEKVSAFLLLSAEAAR